MIDAENSFYLKKISSYITRPFLSGSAFSDFVGKHTIPLPTPSSMTF
jgi:hypothetical protein